MNPNDFPEEASDNFQAVNNEERSVPALDVPRPGRGFAWLLLFAGVYIFASLLSGIVMALYFSAKGNLGDSVELGTFVSSYLQTLDGISIMYGIQFIFIMPVILWASNFPTQSWRRTLAIEHLCIKKFGIWFGVYLIYCGLAILVDSFVSMPLDPFVEMMRGSRNFAFSCVVVFLAPVFEETLFRGYLFKAWRRSWMGLWGTLIVTSILFAAMHVGQYNWIAVAQLFVFSMVLGLAREKTGSLQAPVLLHMINNLISTVLVTYLGYA